MNFILLHPAFFININYCLTVGGLFISTKIRSIRGDVFVKTHIKQYVTPNESLHSKRKSAHNSLHPEWLLLIIQRNYVVEFFRSEPRIQVEENYDNNGCEATRIALPVEYTSSIRYFASSVFPSNSGFM